MTKEIPPSEDCLNEEQEQALMIVLNKMIPPSADGRMPGASEIDFVTYMKKENLISWIREGVSTINEEAYKKYGQKLANLSESEQNSIIENLKRPLARFLGSLISSVIECYYQNDHVLKTIGMESRPPFPDGFSVEEGDLGLLEQVYHRGKIYRDAE